MLFLYKFHSPRRAEQKVSCKAAKLHDINTHTRSAIYVESSSARVIIEYLIRGRKCAVAE